MAFLLAEQLPDPRMSWAPVVLLIIIGLGFVVGNLVLSILIGPGRSGPGKAEPYESGMMPIGDAHKRFNVRFYVVAMIFLVFDVEIVFFYPFATIFASYVKHAPAQSGVILMSMLIFVTILLLAYVYAWGKGVFRWD
ncbi:MAG TPA: NADH-quinone oxidoreductase subunit A [Tepidisphaeraceae bacterium]|jgi:NADH-quinone oxidoreductase subunit A